MNHPIRFFCEDIIYIIRNRSGLRKWIASTAKKEGFEIHSLNYIYCSDSYLLEINRQYLKHNSLTDIITFDLSLTKKVISGEIYISIDRVRENAISYKASMTTELHRVMIHGVLHLCGYADKQKKQRITMRTKEDYYLSSRRFL